MCVLFKMVLQPYTCKLIIQSPALAWEYFFLLTCFGLQQGRVALLSPRHIFSFHFFRFLLLFYIKSQDTVTTVSVTSGETVLVYVEQMEERGF